MRLMRALALLVTVGIVWGFVHRIQAEPEHYGWLYPRGGIVTLGISLLLANGALWVVDRWSHWELSLRRRFEIAVAAWIWLLVQAAIFGSFWLRTRG